jgi:MYXO-CTERM domain-containing protein
VVTNATSATFTFASNESGATFECSLDGAAFAACSSPGTYSALTDGAHTLQVRAKDPVGNLSTPASRTWTVDTVASDTSITQKPEAQTQETSATFAFQATETGSSFECSVDDAAFTACSSPVTFNLTPGNHSLKVRAKDAAGNVDASPAAYSWTISRPSIPGDGDGNEEEPAQGCGCSSPAGDSSVAMMALAGFAAFVSRRRRK